MPLVSAGTKGGMNMKSQYEQMRINRRTKEIQDMIDSVEHLKSLLDEVTEPHEIDLFNRAIRALESALKDLTI
jgi:hypothetical protein